MLNFRRPEAACQEEGGGEAGRKENSAPKAAPDQDRQRKGRIEEEIEGQVRGEVRYSRANPLHGPRVCALRRGSGKQFDVSHNDHQGPFYLLTMYVFALQHVNDRGRPETEEKQGSRKSQREGKTVRRYSLKVISLK